MTPALRVVPPLRERQPAAVVHGSLEHGLTACLALLTTQPDRFTRAAVAWHARWCAHLPGITLDESRTALTALEALAGPDPVAGAHSLAAACRRQGLDDVATVLDAWLTLETWRLALRRAPSAPRDPGAA